MAKRSKSSRRTVGKKGKGKVASSPHPWRLCPLGEHWVVSHPMHVPPSANNPDGSVVTRHGHCHSNPSGKDSIYSDEITEIANKHFTDLVGAPTPDDLGFKHGNDFDSLIRGWTKYWNEVLNPKELLDPNIVKALIATESGFRPDSEGRKNQE